MTVQDRVLYEGQKVIFLHYSLNTDLFLILQQYILQHVNYEGDLKRSRIPLNGDSWVIVTSYSDKNQLGENNV